MNIVGLNSVRPSGVDMVYVQVNELTHETIFCVDRAIRLAVMNNPRAECQDVLLTLDAAGFPCVMHPRNNAVFVHSRPWDEHLIEGGESYFVTFPSDAPYELAGGLFLATANPLLYAAVSADYVGEGRLTIINSDHEPVYFDDEAWVDEHHKERAHIGPVLLIKNQFPTIQGYENACRLLAQSGYELAHEEVLV